MVFRPARFRPAFGRVLTLVVTLIGVASIGGFVVSGDQVGLLRYGALSLMLIAVSWAVFWFPELRIEEHAVTVRNVFRTHRVPWSAIERIDTKWALALYTPGRRIDVWAAPAPSRYSVTAISEHDTRLVAESARAASGSIRPGDSLSSVSGAAAHVLRLQWERLRDDGVLDSTPSHPVRTDWNVGTTAVLGVLAVAGIIGLLL